MQQSCKLKHSQAISANKKRRKIATAPIIQVTLVIVIPTKNGVQRLSQIRSKPLDSGFRQSDGLT